jgi:4a-hydroxytetrahydrobiopterin dehydratase
MSRPALIDSQAALALQAALPGWSLSGDGRAISRRFRFDDFHATMAYVNRLADLAHEQDHHPDLRVGYNYCEVLFTTHDAGGLTTLDASCARAAQALFDTAATER